MRDTEDLDPSEVTTRVLLWFRENKKWLLIIDNLDNIKLTSNYLPQIDSCGHTLITTRNPNSEGIPGYGIEIEAMNQAEGVEFLVMRAGLESDQMIYQNDLEEIVQQLGGLPLAIEQCAAYIKATSRTPGQFLSLYNEEVNRRQLQAWKPKGNRPGNYQYTVSTTWAMSFDLIKQDKSCPYASLLLQLFAFLNPDRISLGFLQSGCEALNDSDLVDLIRNPIKLDETIEVIQEFSLVKRSNKTGGLGSHWNTESIIIHRLVQEVILQEMDDKELSQWWDKIINICFHAFPEELTQSTRSLCREYEDQVTMPLLKYPSKYSPMFSSMLERVGSFLTDEGKYEQSIKFCLMNVHLCDSELGDEHNDTLNAMANLALTYGSKGQWDEAQKLEERVMEASVRLLGE
jgi:hypothetical protein